MRVVVKAEKPYLKPTHRKARLAFAHKYRHWTIGGSKLVLWSDETKVNRIGSDSQVWVWKNKGEPLSDRTTTPTVKHGGGSVMVWGCMAWNRVGIHQEIDGIMDAHNTLKSWSLEWLKVGKIRVQKARFSTSNRIMTPNITPNWLQSSLMIIISLFLTILLGLMI